MYFMNKLEFLAQETVEKKHEILTPSILTTFVTNDCKFCKRYGR